LETVKPNLSATDPKPRTPMSNVNPFLDYEKIRRIEASITNNFAKPSSKVSENTVNRFEKVQEKVNVESLKRNLFTPNRKAYDNSMDIQPLYLSNLDDQLRLTLIGCGLEIYHIKFRNHHISYLEFLRLDEDDLLEIGIINADDRKALWKQICDISSTVGNGKFRLTGSNIPIRYAEVVNIISNMTDQLRRITGTKDEEECRGLEKLHQLIMENPEDLDNGVSPEAIKDLIAIVDSVQESSTMLTREINDYMSSLKEICSQTIESPKKLTVLQMPSTIPAQMGRGRIGFSTGLLAVTAVLAIGSVSYLGLAKRN